MSDKQLIRDIGSAVKVEAAIEDDSFREALFFHLERATKGDGGEILFFSEKVGGKYAVRHREVVCEFRPAGFGAFLHPFN